MNQITVIPSKANPGKFILFNRMEQFSFGTAGTFEEVQIRASKENTRLQECENIRLKYLKQGRY